MADRCRYQQEGINWLAFLRRFKLHGILCDDMGLGKMLQASAIVASDIAESRARNNDKVPISLIICPSTLVAHWEYEIEKYIDSSIMKPLQYIGSSQDRVMLRSQFDMFNVVITSYDIIRKDIDFLGNVSWNYCVLDEGHIIKNSRSKITSAVKQLKAQHRLILSGTPIQVSCYDAFSPFHSSLQFTYRHFTVLVLCDYKALQCIVPCCGFDTIYCNCRIMSWSYGLYLTFLCLGFLGQKNK
jgi:TATA-binding protein-associated factor